jgi:hypothetical protein
LEDFQSHFSVQRHKALRPDAYLLLASMGSKERDVDGRIVSAEGHEGTDIAGVKRLTLPAENNCRKPNPCQRKKARRLLRDFIVSAASVNQRDLL